MNHSRPPAGGGRPPSQDGQHSSSESITSIEPGLTYLLVMFIRFIVVIANSANQTRANIVLFERLVFTVVANRQNIQPKHPPFDIESLASEFDGSMSFGGSFSHGFGDRGVGGSQPGSSPMVDGDFREVDTRDNTYM